MKKGFTIAEVLITLGILGVVIAMTLPQIIIRYEKKETAIRLKKMYTILKNAINQAQIKNGPREYWEFPDDATGKKFYIDEILSNMPCSTTNEKGDCYLNDGSAITLDFVRSYGLVELQFYPKASKKYLDGKAPGRGKRYRLYYSFYFNNPQESIQFYKNVNQYSREYLLNTGPGNFKCKGNDPRACFYLIMIDNWEIKDDYPW